MTDHWVVVKQLNSGGDHAYMNVREAWNGIGVETSATLDGAGVCVLVRYRRSKIMVGFYKFEPALAFMDWWLESSKYISELEFV